MSKLIEFPDSYCQNGCGRITGPKVSICSDCQKALILKYEKEQEVAKHRGFKHDHNKA